jgi:hypothetical protein
VITIEQIIDAATDHIEASIADDASGLLGPATVRKRDELRMLISKWKAQEEATASVQILTQDQLDDIYHLAMFDAENAITKALYANPIMGRDVAIDKLSEAMHEAEIAQMGPRYDRLIKRILAGELSQDRTKS